MFLQVSVCPQWGAGMAGGVHGMGACMEGGGHVWQGRGGICGRGGMYDRGHVWQGSMYGRGVCVTGDVHGEGVHGGGGL